MCLPYANVPHAGGKTLNYYASRFVSDAHAEITMICKVRADEKPHICDNSLIKTIPVYMPQNKINRIAVYLCGINSKFNPTYIYGNTLLSYYYKKILFELNELKKQGYNPDTIILEWTEIVLFIDKIKAIFPKTIIVASEHDVKLQSSFRMYQIEKNVIKRLYRKIQYFNMEKREIEALEKADLVVTQSIKDRDILVNKGIEKNKQLVISPYFMVSQKKWIDNDSHNVVIYGDMRRRENYESAIWYIKNVQPLLKNKNIKLVVLGGNPPDELKQYEDNNIHITGYVDDIFEYLNDAFCMVVPLQFGAGIKVKCLEALDFGIPLLTNTIGIEGIGAEEATDYLLCVTAEEFAKSIDNVFENKKLRGNLAKNALDYAKKNLNMEKSFIQYREKLNV